VAAGKIRQIASKLGYPLIQEYDYQRDDVLPGLTISIKPGVRTRYYQNKALSKMFGGSRARSGIIVLPCGAGKTLTGISAAATIRKSTIVVCSNTLACHQWVQQFLLFTTVSSELVIPYTADTKPNIPQLGAVVLVTTYAMLSMDDSLRSEDSMKTIRLIRARTWGLMILDEAHMVPAEGARKTLDTIPTQCRLGLTATLVREDGQIDDLNFLIGPRLFEADWMRLTNERYLARVQCVEVSCLMSDLFMAAYIRTINDHHRQATLAVMNANKLAACRQIMEKHEADGDKVLIFSDSVYSIEKYAHILKRYMMHGGTPESERSELLRRYRLPHGQKDAIQTLIVSKVADVAIDLPDANVIIQISSHFGSQRQEAQRMGRILRPKTHVSDGLFDAFFYSLISKDTREAVYSEHRREYLTNQGYEYKIVTWDMLGPVKILDKPEEQSLLDHIDSNASTTIKKGEKSIKAVMFDMKQG
jgi:DNA excision repair protein ERCC-3